MPLRDATDYRFAAGTRRLLVRQAETAGDPLAAARQLADRLPDLLAATDVTVRGPDALPAGGTAAVVTANLPADPEAGGRERVQFTAFARFAGQPLTEVTLQADRADADAAGEFDRLVNSARPTAWAGLERVAVAVAAGPTGRQDHPVGGVRLDLTADYIGADRFTVAADDGARFAVERAAVGTRTAVAPDPVLTTGTVRSAAVEGGRTVRYELPPTRPRAAGATAAGVRGVAAGPPAAAVVAGDVGGIPLNITVTAPPGEDAQALGSDLLRQLRAARP